MSTSALGIMSREQFKAQMGTLRVRDHLLGAIIVHAVPFTLYMQLQLSDSTPRLGRLATTILFLTWIVVSSKKLQPQKWVAPLVTKVSTVTRLTLASMPSNQPAWTALDPKFPAGRATASHLLRKHTEAQKECFWELAEEYEGSIRELTRAVRVLVP